MVCSMSTALRVAGTLSVHRTSIVTASSCGVTVAMRNNGPTESSGLGREPMKSWAWAAPATPPTRSAASAHARTSVMRRRSDADRRELARVVLVEREPLGQNLFFEQRVLHHLERLDVEPAVVGEERAGDLRMREDDLFGRPSHPLGDDLGGVPGIRFHELDGAEDPTLRLLDGVGALLDGLFGGVLVEADPLRRHLVEPHE